MEPACDLDIGQAYLPYMAGDLLAEVNAENLLAELTADQNTWVVSVEAKRLLYLQLKIIDI